MARRLVAVGMCAVSLVVLLAVAGCKDSGSPGSGYTGTWTASDAFFLYTLVLTDTTFTYTDVLADGSGTVAGQASGTLAVSGSSMTFTVSSGTLTSGTGPYTVSGHTLTIVGSDFAGTYAD